MRAQIINLDGTKSCTKCGEVKVLSEFGKDNQYKSGIPAQCKKCHAKRVKKYKNSEQGKNSAKIWKEKNSEYIRASQRLRRKNNIEKHREKDKEYRRKNAKKINESQKKYREDSYHDKTKHAYLLFKTVRTNAWKRNIAFSLKISDVVIPEYCPALGIKLIKGNSFDAASVDRIDNNKSYTKDNIIVICRLANMIKNAGTPEQILSVGEFYKRLVESKQ